jgi:hypothetical protein
VEDRYIDYFTNKLKDLPELRKGNSSIDNPAFEKWWGSIKATCERMGETYLQRARKIHFFPSVLGGSRDDYYISQSYQSGLNQAEAFIETLIEELQTWGLNDSANMRPEAANAHSQAPTYHLHVNLSQQQVQQIIQTINLDAYDENTRAKVNELFDELKKEDKDKSKISNIIKWLADKSVDALIAILLAKANLT